jgi:hypothetical protein
MKTFKEFCEEVYQLDEGVPWKPVLKSLGLGFALDAASDKIVNTLPKKIQPGAKKILDTASWGPLAPVAVAGKDEEERVRGAREASKTLAPGERWYGDPKHDARVKQTQPTQGILARGRRTQRNYRGIGTQKP